jgi:hypothetical protein
MRHKVNEVFRRLLAKAASRSTPRVSQKANRAAIAHSAGRTGDFQHFAAEIMRGNQRNQDQRLALNSALQAWL